MALFFPARRACRFDSQGERRLAERLERKLDQDTLCWFNVPIGPHARQPDFTVLHPRRGILVLEVKDWRLETILSMDRERAQVIMGGVPRHVAHPMRQARSYAMEVVRLLQQDPALLQPEGSAHAGQLACPYGWGVVMTHITRRQFEQSELSQVMDPGRVLFQDEMTEATDDAAFQDHLWQLFTQWFPCHLSPEQVHRIRYHLYPEIRVNPAPGQFGLFDPEGEGMPSMLQVMDLQQEQLARSLGEGHRVIHGVAGSGKTMILVYRCVHLARATTRPILVLCYNRSLAGRLQQVLAQKGLGEQVQVRTFHAWCREQLLIHGVPLPAQGDHFFDELVTSLQRAMDTGQVPAGQYAGVLIDEGHDFLPDWFRLAVRSLDPKTGALLVLYDDAQSIYRRRRGLDFSFASVNIQAQGRTTILRLNYRNTLEVLSVARAFARDLLEQRDAGEDGVPVVAPESAGRRGPCPELLLCQSDWQERQCVIQRLLDERDQGREWSDMAILLRSSAEAPRLRAALVRADIPFADGLGSQRRGQLYGDQDEVKLVTMHSSKGLEFGLVILPALHRMPAPDEEVQDEARILYVAMTRAMERLVMTAQGHSVFTQRLEEVIASVRQRLLEH